MSTKYKIITSVLALLIAFATGRFLAPTKIITVTHTVEVEKKVDTVADQDHKVVKVVEVHAPDGTDTKTTTVTDDDSKKEISTDNSSTVTDTKKTVERGSDKVTISVLAGASPFSKTPATVYGASLTKPVLGPITVGIFGLSNSVVGASIGLTF